MLLLTILIVAFLASFVALLSAKAPMAVCLFGSLGAAAIVAMSLSLGASMFGDDNTYVTICDAKVMVLSKVSDDHTVGYLEDGRPVAIAPSHTLKHDVYGRTPRLEVLKHCSIRATGWWTGMDIHRIFAKEKSYTDTTLYVGSKE